MSADKTPAPAPAPEKKPAPAPKPAQPINQADHGRVRRPYGGK